MWMAGLSHGNDDTTYADIDFGFRFNGGGYADVLESGIYAGGDTTYAAGDVFRIAIANGRVEYSKNGHYLMESLHIPQLPLLLDSSLLSMGATIRDAVIAVTPPPPPGGGLIEKAGSPALRSRFTQLADPGVSARRRRQREVQLSGAIQHRGGSSDEWGRLRRRC